MGTLASRATAQTCTKDAAEADDGRRLLGWGGEPKQRQGHDEISAAIADELAVAATPEMVPYE